MYKTPVNVMCCTIKSETSRELDINNNKLYIHKTKSVLFAHLSTTK